MFLFYVSDIILYKLYKIYSTLDYQYNMGSFVAFVLSIVLGLKHSPQFIGKNTECFVNKKLSKLNHDYYKVLSDVLLPSAGNQIGTTQIDQIVVSNFGIFCIETKAYSGWIFGRAEDKYWTQVIYHKKSRFYNPLWQNFGHVKTIENLIATLNIKVPVYSYVAFPDADNLRITGTDLVGYAGEVVKKIKFHNQFVLSNIDRDRIVDEINQINIVDKNIRKEHIKKINEIIDAPPPVRYKNNEQVQGEIENIFDDDDEEYDDDF